MALEGLTGVRREEEDGEVVGALHHEMEGLGGRENDGTHRRFKLGMVCRCETHELQGARRMFFSIEKNKTKSKTRCRENGLNELN